MESEFPAMPLGQLAKLRSGFPFKSADWTEEGFPVIKIANVKAGRIVPEGCAYVAAKTAEAAADWWTREGDVLIAMTGYVGELARVGKHERYLINQRVGRFEVTPASRVLAHFLFYALQHPEIRSELETIARGSAQPNLSAKDAERIEIPVPQKSEQQKIVELLASLDDRIDLLRQTNATLESIAQALFKSWFIDFDPVRAKAEGREPEGMDAATAALFPGELEESALGMIPKGWSAIPFAETVSIMGGGTPKTSVPEFWGGDIPWFSVVDAPGAGQVFTMRTEKSITSAGVENSSTRVLPAWTTIISARGTVGKLAMTARPMAMNQSCYGLAPRLPGTEPLVYLAAQRLVDDLKRLAHGGVFDTITRDTLSSVSIVQAPPDVQSALAAMVKPVFEKIQQGVERISVLTELRDTLLPRLISGKLRLPEAQEQVEDALA